MVLSQSCLPIRAFSLTSQIFRKLAAPMRDLNPSIGLARLRYSFMPGSKGDVVLGSVDSILVLASFITSFTFSGLSGNNLFALKNRLCSLCQAQSRLLALVKIKLKAEIIAWSPSWTNNHLPASGISRAPTRLIQAVSVLPGD